MKRKCILILTLVILCVAMISAALAEDDPWICPNCGRADNTFNFCPSCGEPRPATDWTCPVCGREGNEDNFCPSCGNPRSEAQAMAESKAGAKANYIDGTYAVDKDTAFGEVHVEITVKDGIIASANLIEDSILLSDIECEAITAQIVEKGSVDAISGVTITSDAISEAVTGLLSQAATGKPASTPVATATPQPTATPAPVSDEDALSRGIAAYEAEDWESALEYLKPLADKGEAEAQWRVGVMFHNGQGVEENDELAATYFQFSAEHDNAWGHYWYARALDYGWGVEKDPAKAMELYLLSAVQGVNSAFEYIALNYQEGNGVPQDYDKAAYYLSRFLKSGGKYAPGIFESAVRDAAEEISKRDDITSPEEAISITNPYQAETLYQKGRRYYDEQLYSFAAEEFQKAADMGHIKAQYRLGCMFYYGEGVPKDYVRASEYLKSAADQGFDPSQYAMGYLYEHGNGVEQDYDRAMYYYQLALENGNQEAQKGIQRLNALINDASKGNTSTALSPTAVPTVAPTAAATAVPTATPKTANAGWDIPSVIENISVPIIVGQKGSGKATEWCTAYEFSSYDYYGSDTKAEWAKQYIEAVTQQGPFEQVDYFYRDMLSVGSEYETYYFRYTGDKQLSDFDGEWDLSFTPKRNDLQVDVSHHHADDHVCVSVRWPKELVFADKDLVEGTSYNGEAPNPNSNPDSNPDPVSVQTHNKPKQPCPKCHGKKEVDCSQCQGQGGKNIYDHSTKSTGYTWENCFKCKGRGKVACAYCGGDGYIND